jgi:subtilisin family serine protease
MYRKVFNMLSILIVLSIVLSATVPALAAQDPTAFTATPLFPESTITVAKAIRPNAPEAGSGMVSVLVKLEGDSLAAYTGDIPGLAATNPSVTGEEKLDTESKESKEYLRYLDRKHDEFEAEAEASIPEGQVTQNIEVILNVVSMIVPADQVSSLYSLPGVEAVYADELQQLTTDNSPQFIGAPTARSQLGGQESAGEGVIVGILDTGIWPEHPSFSDPDPSGKPYAAPPPAPSGNPRACEFGSAVTGDEPFACNNKLIGAHRFMATYDVALGTGPGEFLSARDDDGHGTHTSSTSAGNANVPASIFGVSRGTVSGIAPRAHVIMYKVCGEAGCFGSDSAAAVQQAIRDGVDVINFSISGGANPYSDAVELAFLNAYDAGVFVAASAGNSGPSPETTDHRGPWVTTVAASTQDRSFENSVTLSADGGATLTLTGVSITGGVGAAPVVVPADAQCNSPFAPGSVAGMVVVCRRGVTGRAEKGFNVLQGGAAGMILYNQAANVTDLETDNHYLPATHLQFSQGTQVLSFIASNTNVQATITAGNKAAGQGDVMASFSSRGGPGQTLGVSKPDITAPGVQILAGASPLHVGVASGPQGELFQAIAGTSMSGPHIAGAGALIKALHPDWTPGQIKSALMTTAWTQVVKEDGVTPATPFDNGSGRVDLNKAGDPGLTFDVTAADYVTHKADLWNVNYPSIYVPVMPGSIELQRTAHSLLPKKSEWKLKVVGASDFTVSVPKELTVSANGYANIKISIDARNVPIGQTRSATLYLKQDEGGRTLHIPITFVRKQAPVTLTKTCSPASIAKGKTTDCVITIQNTTLTDAQFNITDKMPSQLKLISSSVVGGQVSRDGKTISFSGTLTGSQPPSVAIGDGTGLSPAGYVPLSVFGIAPVGGVSDESISNFNVPDFTYAGSSYTRIGVTSNGYLVVGGGTGADIQFINQSLPDATRPNNVLAPFWTDLDPGAAGAIRVGILGDGTNNWIVVDWNAVQEFSTPAQNSFQIWIGLSGDANPAEDITFTYGTLQGNGDGGFMTVGAENLFGNRGANYYVDGVGTLPSFGTELVVTGIPGVSSAPYIITYSAKGEETGSWVNYALMTSNLFQGTSIAAFSGTVTRR